MKDYSYYANFSDEELVLHGRENAQVDKSFVDVLVDRFEEAVEANVKMAMRLEPPPL